MTKVSTKHKLLHEWLRFGAPLSEAQARELAQTLLAEDEESLTFLLLELARTTQPFSESPSTPSGMIAPYQKEPAKKSRKKAGAKPGHPGIRRAQPERADSTFKCNRDGEKKGE